MARRALAPVLSAFVDGGDDVNRATIKVQAAAELRALLAVARAATRVSDAMAGDEDVVEKMCALDRALIRLARAKGKP
jgi:hypothetical protein